MPKVSVLMNCYNGEAFLKEAIDSVYAQTFKDWEIIFWDNASTDRSAEIARSYMDGRLKYFRGEVNVPLYAARNLALEKVQGEFIGFLDVDDLWAPEKLEKQLPLFDDHRVGLVYCDSLFFKDGKTIHRYFSNKQAHRGDCFEQLFENYFLPLEAVLVRKKALDEWPYAFDGRFSHIGDADLFRRIAYRWKLDFVEAPLAYWRVHSASLSWTHSERFFQETELLVRTYREILPEIDQKYPRALRFLEREVAVGKAKRSIQQGSGKRAAFKELTAHLKDKKAFLMMILCLLPNAFSKKLLASRNMA